MLGPQGQSQAETLSKGGFQERREAQSKFESRPWPAVDAGPPAVVMKMHSPDLGTKSPTMERELGNPQRDCIWLHEAPGWGSDRTNVLV